MASDMNILTHESHDTDKNRERKRRRIVRKSSQSSSWSDLHQDILWLVVQRLYISDRVALRAVCKNWRLAPAFDKLPWLLNYYVSRNHIKCSLSDPYHRQLYTVEEEKRWTDTPGRAFRSIACASSYGWVLFRESTSELVNFTPYRFHEYYVYNPHTKAVISLPKLKELSEHAYVCQHLATFSSAPTSSDCMFVIPSTFRRGRDFFLSTYSIGDTTWKTQRFPCPNPRFIFTPFMAYMDGSFYYYSWEGDLSSFHIATRKWSLLLSEKLKIPERNLGKKKGKRTLYFVAYGGHLHLVYLTELEAVDRAPECCIFRNDWVDGNWKKMDNLEGGALFLGDPLSGVYSFGVSASGGGGGEETKMVVNRVYYMSSYTSKLRFLVYGSEDHSTEEISESSQNKIYYESSPWKKEIKTSFYERFLKKEKKKRMEEIRSWMWMEPPTLTLTV